MVPNENDGQPHGQSAEAGGEGGDNSEGGGGARGGSSKLEDLEARIDLINDNFAELRSAILQKNAPAPSASVQVELDDDTPLNAKKVNAIIQQNLDAAIRNGNAKAERQTWDMKAGQEFPLKDPKFLREFQREWREQVESGLDPRHPKALYNVAKIVARSSGVVKREPQRRDPEADPTLTSEPSSQGRRTERTGGAKAVSDDDPRVKLYKMGGPSKERVENFKKKLGERDAAAGRRQTR